MQLPSQVVIHNTLDGEGVKVIEHLKGNLKSLSLLKSRSLAFITVGVDVLCQDRTCEMVTFKYLKESTRSTSLMKSLC